VFTFRLLDEDKDIKPYLFKSEAEWNE
jgi:hypothetical protein